MEKIKVDKVKLIAVLQENKAKHRALFEKAVEGDKTKAMAFLEEKLAALRADKPVQIYFNLSIPTDQTRDYERAIKMLEMSVEDTVVLSEADFQQYVQDQWVWKKAWLSNSSNYAQMPVEEDGDA